MKPNRIESLVSWMWTGAILIGVGLYFFVAGWLFPGLGAPLLRGRRSWPAVEPEFALAGAALFLALGVFLVAFAIIGRLRSRDE